MAGSPIPTGDGTQNRVTMVMPAGLVPLFAAAVGVIGKEEDEQHSQSTHDAQHQAGITGETVIDFSVFHFVFPRSGFKGGNSFPTLEKLKDQRRKMAGIFLSANPPF